MGGDGLFGGAPTLFIVFFAIIVMTIIGGAIYNTVSSVKSRKVLRDAGIDPMTVWA